MKSSKELFERLSKDEAFAKEFATAITAKREAGAANYFETVIPAAADFGYEISEEEVQAIADAQKEELSEEELGKVAGGTSCIPSTMIYTMIASTLFSLATVSIASAIESAT